MIPPIFDLLIFIHAKRRIRYTHNAHHKYYISEILYMYYVSCVLQKVSSMSTILNENRTFKFFKEQTGFLSKIRNIMYLLQEKKCIMQRYIFPSQKIQAIIYAWFNILVVDSRFISWMCDKCDMRHTNVLHSRNCSITENGIAFWGWIKEITTK